MSADWFTACKARYGLIDYCLENGSCKVFLGSSFINKRLDIGLCKYAAAGCNGLKGLIALSIFIEARCIGLKKRCHLVDE